MRVELIALHAAGNYPGAQLYMECAQVSSNHRTFVWFADVFKINVTGGGSASPAGVNFPGAYKGDDPGIKFQVSLANIHSPTTFC